MGDIKLNIGAGDTVIPGYVAIDRKLGSEAYPLNYPDNSVSEIRCSHLLEHLDFRQVQTALIEWHRVLKPGGRLRIAVPDVAKVLASKDSDPAWRFHLMGGQMDADDYHRSAFDEGLLRMHLEKFGFERVQPWESPNTDTAAHPCSLNLEGFKPEAVETVQNLKVLAVTSIPRIGWNDHWGCVQDELYPLGIRLHRSQGAFWGQCIQRAFEHSLKQGVDWLLCLDYDTLFTTEHISRLMDIFAQNPHIDALAAMQILRQGDTPLLTTGRGLIEEIDVVNPQPIKVRTAHFGLTLIRMDALSELPKPWFASAPDERGEWGEGRIDDDIWFWKQWEKFDRSAYVAPDVRVGHLEVMVSDFDEHYQPRHTHVKDWRNMHNRLVESD